MHTYNEIGLKDGPFEGRWNNGSLWFKGTYVNGNRHGLYEIYYSNGNIDSRYIYFQGKIKGFAEEYLSDSKLRVKRYIL